MTVSRPPQPAPPISWTGWGDPGRQVSLPEDLRGLLHAGLGVQRPGSPAPSMQELALRESRLPAAVVAQLEQVVGPRHLDGSREARLRHLRGKSTVDLLRLRQGDTGDAPDVVACPADHEEVQALLEVCTWARVAVVPFGGGTSVVGGLEPAASGLAGVVALDLARLDALLALDEESRVAELQAGLRGPQAEALLGSRGYTLGHFPQSFEYATLGGFAATRSTGQASAGYGRFDEMVVGLRVATPAGSLELGRAPRSAAGPDLRQMMLGSEGTLGVISSLRLRVHPVPERRLYSGWRFGSFRAGVAAARRLAQDGPLPTIVRLSDEAETALGGGGGSGGGGGGGGGCLMVCGYEGTGELVEATSLATSRVLREAGAEPVDGAGEHWRDGRYEAPYLRDALLDAGALVETLETACLWSGLDSLYNAVGEALRGTPGVPVVTLCHVSHVYATGASLYFTVACAQGEDPVARWRELKGAASNAILQAGGTITHHHGVGRDHVEPFGREIGELGVEALRAIKSRLDPAGIMNPGVLVGPALGATSAA